MFFDTLDGHTARSEGGAATLSAVGNLIRDKKNTFVVYDAIGVDIHEYYAKTMGLPRERLILAFSMLAHQPTKSISIPESANRDLVAQADMLYSHQPPNVGLQIFNTQPKLIKSFQAIYNQNGALQAKTMPGFIQAWAPLLAMLHLVTWKIDGYHEFEHLENNKELWSLLLKAQKDILTLPRFGWAGWILSILCGSWFTSKLNKIPVEGALPLSYREFNAFHHGSKVVKQDVEVLKQLLAEGEKAGRKMDGLREICRRIDDILKKGI